MKRTGEDVDDDERGRAGKDRVRVGGRFWERNLYMQHNLGSLFSLPLFLRNSTTTQSTSPHLTSKRIRPGKEERKAERERAQRKQASIWETEFFIYPSIHKEGGKDSWFGLIQENERGGQQPPFFVFLLSLNSVYCETLFFRPIFLFFLSLFLVRLYLYCRHCWLPSSSKCSFIAHKVIG